MNKCKSLWIKSRNKKLLGDIMNPILLNLPIPIKTPRLLLRPPQAGDGVIVNAAILESYEQLHPWMPWADHKPTVEETETFMRQFQAKWILREELVLLIFDHTGTKFLGSTGFHCKNWNIPSFEIGYWIRSSCANQGIITESTNALTSYAFKQLQAKRVAITMDADNTASRKVAEKLGFALEGILINNACKTDKITLRDDAIYARYNCDALPPLEVTW
jgi:RimJ/RimL family protein N-acetyltransferase